MTVRTGAELLAMAMANESVKVAFGLPCQWGPETRTCL